jgi:hypothetical protein
MCPEAARSEQFVDTGREHPGFIDEVEDCVPAADRSGEIVASPKTSHIHVDIGRVSRTTGGLQKTAKVIRTHELCC